MNILYICTYYHRARIFRDSMNALIKRGHKVTAFNAVYKGTELKEEYADLMDDLVIHRECFNKNDRYIYPLKQKKIFETLEKEYKNHHLEDTEIIHSHTLLNGGLVAYKMYKKYNIPYVVSVRDTDLNTFLKVPVLKYYYRAVSKKILKNAKAVLFLSRAYRQELIGMYDKLAGDLYTKSTVIPNGLERYWLDNCYTTRKTVRLSEYANIKKPNNKKPFKETINLLCVGSIEYRKNQEIILEAARILRDKGAKIETTIIGNVVDPEIHKSLNEHKHVKVLPFMPKEQLIEYYRNADIFVLPSLTETFGRVYTEAMTQALPVIYTKGQGFDGMYAEGTVGYAVSPTSAQEIADRIEDILVNYRLISEYALLKSKRFDWDNLAITLEKFYKNAIKRPNKQAVMPIPDDMDAEEE